MANQAIVIVEDDPTIVEATAEVLADEGYRTVVWANGSSAPAVIERERPALVILDLWLGTAETGWTILQRMRADPATAQTPVIIFTADSRSLREHGPTFLEQGCTILPKPFDLVDLLAQVEAAIGRPEGGAA